eukprot:TRINITY_DN3652_c0_g1_i1.p1 TRINITY_DN3652_c0_g1~~TRINITY_DN3652_c0_g1_i1.p1  ORF type:complete len:422 (-),score=113.53 TRINITY_DN3652_c0_g1_i1:47-1276(-)
MSTESKSNVPHYPTNSEEYILKAEIGKGAFATVYLATCTTLNSDVAIKILDLDELDANWEEVRKEIAVMGMLNHPNVVRFLCSFVVEREIWLVMPLLAGGSCADIMKRNFPQGLNDEVLIATILKETLRGLLYFHKDGRIHRDVKAGNILISSEGDVQIADFGVAGTLVEAGDRKKTRRTFVGTPCWMAPEVMEQSQGYDYKADIWSFGITALELAYGRPPYSQYQPMKVMLLTLQESPPTPDVYEDNPKKVSKHFRDLVTKCLKKEPTKRPTAEKLLEHKFFKLAKDKQYVIDHLLNLVPRPKWASSAAAEPLKREKEPTFEEEENSKGISGAWEFDDGEFQKMQAQFAEERASSGVGVTEQKGRFEVTDQGGDDDDLDDPDPNFSSSLKPAEDSKPVQKGRFLIQDS